MHTHNIPRNRIEKYTHIYMITKIKGFMQEINTTKEKIYIEDITSERKNDVTNLTTRINDIKSRKRKKHLASL